MTERKMIIGEKYGRYEAISSRATYRKNKDRSIPVLQEFVPGPEVINMSSEMSSEAENEVASTDDEFELTPRFVKAPEMQSLNLPKDIMARTARTAIGLGISNNQANALISSVVANAGGDVDQITLSVASTHRIQHKIITEDAAILRRNITAKIRESNQPIIVHFDGKIIRDFTKATDKTKDRLCAYST